MKKLWGFVGNILFWLLWPAIYVYFRFFPERSRVLLVCEDEILLVLNWLGDREYSLPGGGLGRHETMASSAVREIKEELGIVLPESGLKRLGAKTFKRHAISYKATFFVVELAEKPELKVQKHEILSARWVAFDGVPALRVNRDVDFALKRYQPATQEALL